MFEDRYIFASALQKSVRRGLTEDALNIASLLIEKDFNYFIYRIGIILAEDVGVSNEDLLAKYINLKLAKKEIEAAGGKDFLLSIVKEACDSIKDRSSCDIAYFSSHVTYWAISTKEFQELISLDKEKRLSYICNVVKTDINPALKVNLIWAALGQKKYPNEQLKELNLFDFPKLKNGKDDDNPEAFKAILQSLGLTEKQIEITLNSYLTQNEFMCLGMAITFAERNLYLKQELSQDNNFSTKIETINFSDDKKASIIGYNFEIPFASIDGHTSQGKAAYTMFLKKKGFYYRKMESLGFSFNKIQELLPFFMFRLEGQQVDKREYFPFAAKTMFIGNQIALNHSIGLPFNSKEVSFKDIKDELKKDIPEINALRSKTVNFNRNKDDLYSSFNAPKN